MYRLWLASILAVTFAGTFSLAASAEEDWKMPRILPFPSSKAEPVRRTAPAKATSRSLIRPVSAIVPDILHIARRDPHAPSPWDRLATGTMKLHAMTTSWSEATTSNAQSAYGTYGSSFNASTIDTYAYTTSSTVAVKTGASYAGPCHSASFSPSPADGRVEGHVLNESGQTFRRGRRRWQRLKDSADG